jgi:hypothetical protein
MEKIPLGEELDPEDVPKESRTLEFAYVLNARQPTIEKSGP